MICSCGLHMVKPFGNLSSNVVILGDYPSFDDVKNGMAFTGPGGMALRQELAKAGVQPEGVFMTLLYPHNMGKTSECVEDWETNAMGFLRKKKLILLLGKAVPVFTQFTAEQVSGIKVPSALLKGSIVVAGPGITTALKSPIGELRRACEVFAEERRKV